MALHEREFFTETNETKLAPYSCPKCRFRGDYYVRWIRRIKLDQTDKKGPAAERR